MPELPEVEITKRGVAGSYLRQVLKSVTVSQPMLRWPVPETVHLCQGSPLGLISRRSKYLLMHFGDWVQVVHLGMSGALKIVSPSDTWEKHDHIQWEFESGALRLNDPRRFGSVECIPTKDLHSHVRFALLGPEPLGDAFTPDGLYAYTRGKKLSIKALLLSGKAVVGVGNIYACESLFRAAIRPGRAAGRLTRHEAHVLWQVIRDVLGEAIERGGSTLRNFHAIDGELGYFQLSCAVYGREGQACPRCGGLVKRRVMGQRSTFYCPGCQK